MTDRHYAFRGRDVTYRGYRSRKGELCQQPNTQSMMLLPKVLRETRRAWQPPNVVRSEEHSHGERQ